MFVCCTRELMDVIKVIGKRMSLAHPSGKHVYRYMCKEMQILENFVLQKFLTSSKYPIFQ